jgi:hypothetical protein
MFGNAFELPLKVLFKTRFYGKNIKLMPLDGF